jgi:hypothetical protein
LYNKLAIFLDQHKLLSLISLLNFVLIYSSTFVPGYGYFIDEFYYIACANHLAFGYVDQPPLAPFILAVWKFVFGDSLYSIRILPALASSATILMTGLLAEQLGGNKTAQVMSALCILASPVYAAMAGFYSMNAYEPLLSVTAFYLIVRMIKENNPKRWLGIGIVFGLGLMNKHTAGVYIFLIVVSMLLTQWRKLLFTKWLAYCVLISALIFLPDVFWNAENGFPTIEFYRNITIYKNVPVPPVQFVINQILFYSPIIFPVWFAGMLYLLFGKKLKQYRILGLLFLFSFLFFMATRTSRPDRLAFAFPLVIPAGVIFFQTLFSKYRIRWLYGVFVVLLFAWFCMTVPILLPYLNYQLTASLTKFLGISTEMEAGNRPKIPQTLADRIGWQEKVDMVGKVYLSLPGSERDSTIIAAQNYGMAGALELLGKKYGFRYVVSGHNNYYFWSKSRLHGDIVLETAHKKDIEGFRKSFGIVDTTDTIFQNEYATPHEQNLTVFICRKPIYPLDTLLERGRFFY